MALQRIIELGQAVAAGELKVDQVVELNELPASGSDAVSTQKNF